MEIVKRIVNLTPHAIVLRTGEGPETDVTIPPSGTVARVNQGEARPYLGYMGCPVPVYRQGPFAAIEGLPDYEDGTLLIVSGMVASALKEYEARHRNEAYRTDVVAPGTGPTDGAIRNDKGHIVAVTRLVRA